jgi:hypothetical protein
MRITGSRSVPIALMGILLLSALVTGPHPAAAQAAAGYHEEELPDGPVGERARQVVDAIDIGPEFCASLNGVVRQSWIGRDGGKYRVPLVLITHTWAIEQEFDCEGRCPSGGQLGNTDNDPIWILSACRVDTGASEQIRTGGWEYADCCFKQGRFAAQVTHQVVDSQGSCDAVELGGYLDKLKIDRDFPPKAQRRLSWRQIVRIL